MSGSVESGVARGKRTPLWKGRANRKEYWVWVAMIVGVGIVMSVVGLKSGNSATTVLLAFIQARRFRDFGRSGLWAIALVVAALSVTLIAVLRSSVDMAVAVGLLVTLIPLIWIGVVPGDPHENRFGAPTGGRNLRDIFS